MRIKPKYALFSATNDLYVSANYEKKTNVREKIVFCYKVLVSLNKLTGFPKSKSYLGCFNSITQQPATYRIFFNWW